jgi:hypothetical protein
MFHFIEKTLHGDKKPGGGVFGFLDEKKDEAVKRSKKIQNPGIALANAQMDRFGALKPFVQGALRVPEKAVRSSLQLGSDLADPKHELGKRDFSTGAPTDSIRKTLYGGDELQTYQKAAAGNKKALEEGTYLGSGTIGGKGVANKHASTIAAGAGILTAGLDLTGFGGGKKDIIKTLVKANDVSAVKNLLPNVADHTAQAIASTKDPHVIENLVSGKTLERPPDVNIPKTEPPKAPEPQVNPQIADLENQIKHTKEMKQHAANDTAKAKLDSKARRLIGEKEKLVSNDLKVNNPLEANIDTPFPVENRDGAKIGFETKNPGGAEQTVSKKADYGMNHRPANTAPAHDLNKMAPDIYEHPEYYRTGQAIPDKQSVDVIKSIKGKPDAEVTLYRAAPKGELNKGDWVSLSKDYAKQEAKTEGVPVHSFKVKASEIGWPGDSINEFGYFGKGIKEFSISNPMGAVTTNLKGAARQAFMGKNEAGFVKLPKGRGPIEDITPPSPIPKQKTVDSSIKNTANSAGSGERFIGKTLLDATIPKAVSGEVVPKNAFDEILGAVRGQKASKGSPAVKGIATASREQAQMLSKERGARFKAGAEAGKNKPGSEGYFTELKAMKGEYSKANFTPMIDDIGPERTEELFTKARQQILDTPDHVYEEMGLHPGGARVNTQTAVRKVLGLEPGVPTKSDLKLLAVQNPRMAAEIGESIPKARQLFDWASKIAGSSRSAKSTADLSMGGRQGLFVAGRNPVEWAEANKESVKYAANKKYYKEEMSKIHDDEWGQLIDGRDSGVLTGGASHEEAYAGSDVLKQVKGVGDVVEASERAYTGGLTKLRKDIIVKSFKAYGDTPEEVMKVLGPKGVDGLIEVGRTLTGRGGKAGGWVAKNHGILNEALFSPKLWASRLEPLNPMFWKRIGPAGRKVALENYGSFAVVAGLVLSAAVAAGAQVETDPRSSDFLKIKVGDTRYDILGGFQQNLVFLARQATGETKSSTSGVITKYGERGGPNRLTAGFDLVRNKANPVVGAAANIWEGTDKAGNKVNPLTEIGQLFVPISIQGTYHGIQDDGLKGALKNSPDIVGIGSQTYGTKDINITDKQKTYIKKLESQGKSKEEVSANKLFFQTVKTAPSKDNASEAIKAALKDGNEEKAIKLSKEYNKAYADTFKDWRKQYSKYRKNETLVKEYNKNKITSATLERWRND